MANLKVKIVLRLPANEGRGWIAANGKTDPQGVYYLHYYSGSKPKHECVDGNFHDAEIAALRLERKLKAHSQGFVVPEEKAIDKPHRISDVIESYCKHLAVTTKKNGRRYSARSISARKNELLRFTVFSGLAYVEEITRETMLAFKESLYAEGGVNDTVLNKLKTVTTLLERNTGVKITGLLTSEDWPLKKTTTPRPFRELELKSMMEIAEGEERLILRTLSGTGMRKDEVQHFEIEDVDGIRKCVHVHDKPHLSWETKTLASVREIPLGDSLLADLTEFMSGKTGLVFPNPRTGRPEGNLDRMIKRIAKLAKVAPPPLGEKEGWCHRWI